MPSSGNGSRSPWSSVRSSPAVTSSSRTSPGWARPSPPDLSRPALGLEFTRAQFTPDLLPGDLTGSFVYDQRERVRVPARAAVHRAAARRRDQPHAAQDPVGAARGDAGTPGHRRGPDLPARRARSTCSPPRTPLSTRAPTRCRRPSSTGSSCGSPSATRRRRRGVGGACATGSRASARSSRSSRVTDAAGLLAMQDAVETVAVDDTVGRILRRSRNGDPRPRAHACSARRHAARWP